jgi:ATP-binding cassette, subfamily B, multidrug efflux pump
MSQLRPLLRFLRPYWRRSLVSLVLLIIVVILDLAIPRLVQRLIDQGISAGDQQVVVSSFLIMLLISALNTFFAVLNNNYSVQVGEAYSRDLREALFTRIQSFSYGNLDRLKTGQLLVRLTSDTTALQRLVQVSLRIGTRAPLLMAGSVVLMFATSPRLALTLLPLLVVTGVVLVFFVVRMGPLFMSVQRRLDRLNTVLQENIAGARVVKAFVRDAYEEERFEEANEDFTAYHIRVMRFMSSMGPILTLFLNVGIVGVIWAGGLQAIEGDLTTGQIAAFVNYLQTTLGPLMIMANLANVWAAGLVSAGRVNEVLETEPEIQDAPGAVSLPPGTRPRVTFEDVHFHYNGQAGQDVLRGVSLDAAPGETVAILGATGAGKSTLVSLIPRFYDVTGGRVLVGGVDVRQLAQDDLLSHIAIVPQETVLFSGTVRDNIRYARPQAEEAEVIAAAQAAQAHEFILALPNGYDTHIEQRGVNLSGGQKQRIAIARALLARPSILILDDSTSAVDVETETRIQDALDDWVQGSRFVVAQRISTVLKADKILVLDKGRVAAMGQHRELLQSSPIYQEIYASQLGEAALNGRNGRGGKGGAAHVDASA